MEIDGGGGSDGAQVDLPVRGVGREWSGESGGVLEPSPVVALAREVYATVRLRGRDYGVDSLRAQPDALTPFSGKVLIG